VIPGTGETPVLQRAVTRCGTLFAAVAILIYLAGSTSAQTSQPVKDPENEIINFDPATVRAVALKPTGSLNSNSGSADLTRMLSALMIVVAVIFVLRWAARRMALVPGAANSGAVKVISRSTVSPRQQVLVLQVGRRLVVVGDSGGRMNPLCEITDPDEVAAMIGGSHQANAANQENPKSFMNLFSRASEPFETEANLPAAAEAESMQNIEPIRATDNEDVGSLLNKVRELRQQFQQTGS
jgi:flagellar biogenesis protein FliO